MAEFCLSCLNEMTGESYTAKDVVLSKEHEYCEECLRPSHIVVGFKRGFALRESLRLFREKMRRARKK